MHSLTPFFIIGRKKSRFVSPAVQQGCIILRSHPFNTFRNSRPSREQQNAETRIFATQAAPN